MDIITLNGGAQIPAIDIDLSTYRLLGVPAFKAAASFICDNFSILPACVIDESSEFPQRDRQHNVCKLLNRRISKAAGQTVTKSTLALHVILYGNGYLGIERDKKGNPTELINLDPNYVIPFRVNGQKYFFLQKPKEVRLGYEIIHIMGLTHDGLRGLNPIDAQQYAYLSAITTQTYSYEYWKHGTHVNGIIEVPAGLEPKQFQNLMSSWKASHSGDNPGKTGFLQFGATWKATTTDNQKSELMKQLDLSASNIAEMTGVPVQVTNKLTKGGAVSGQERLDAIRFIVEQFEDESTLKLLTEAEIDSGKYVQLEIDRLKRGDPQFQADIISAVNNGILTPNRGAAMLGYDPVPGGDIARMPTAIATPIKQGGKDNAPNDPATQSTDATEATASTPASGTKDAADESYQAKSSFNVAPVVADIARRVQTKERKAIEFNKGKKFEDEDEKFASYMAWLTEFAPKQSAYLAEALQPLASITKQDYTATIRAYEEAVIAGEQFDLEGEINAYHV